MESFSFDLIYEPWISYTDLKGDYSSVGINDVLMRAHEIRSIEHQNPLTEVAFFRVLLAVIHRAVNGPRTSNEWKRMYQAGKFDARIQEYLEKWRQRLDLFSPSEPFYQTAGLRVVDKSEKPVPQTVVSIALEKASGHNKTLFDHTTAELSVRLSPAEAAQKLITAQMFSLRGLNKKITNLFGYQQSYLNAAMVSGIYIVLSGKSLFETLMLNLLLYNDNEPIPRTEFDCPIWERNDIGGTTASTPKGYLDFLTCKCRHILLVPQQKSGDVFVEHMHIAQAEAFPEVDNPAFINKRKKDGSWYHPQLNPDRLVWRDSNALFAFNEEIDQRPKVFHHVKAMGSTVNLPSRYMCIAFALANDQANPLAWRKEKINIPLSLLSDENVVAYLIKGMAMVDLGERALDSAVKSFMHEYHLQKNSKGITEKSKSTGAERLYWDRMESNFHQFLLDMDDPEKALEKWERAIKKTAHESLDLCLRDRYRNAYKAWEKALSNLNMRLAGLNN